MRQANLLKSNTTDISLRLEAQVFPEGRELKVVLLRIAYNRESACGSLVFTAELAFELSAWPARS